MRISNFYALFYSLGKVGCTLIKDYQVFGTNALLIYSVPDPPRFIRVGGAGYASLCKSLHKLTAQLSTTENNSISPVPLIKNNTIPTSILTREQRVCEFSIWQNHLEILQQSVKSGHVLVSLNWQDYLEDQSCQLLQ